MYVCVEYIGSEGFFGETIHPVAEQESL